LFIAQAESKFTSSLKRKNDGRAKGGDCAGLDWGGGGAGQCLRVGPAGTGGQKILPPEVEHIQADGGHQEQGGGVVVHLMRELLVSHLAADS